MKADGGQHAGQGQTAIRENDQGARRVGAADEDVIDGDTEDSFRLVRVAVAGIPEPERQVGTPVHAGSAPLGGAGCAGSELIEELL